MFNKIAQTDIRLIGQTEDTPTILAFIKSTNVYAFPCGRRRSTLIEEKYRLPFDPEARLNTEANNRRQASVNGFTQTFLSGWNKDNDGQLSLTLNGYNFKVDLVDKVEVDGVKTQVDYTDANDFVNAIKAVAIDNEKKLMVDAADRIYANIIIKNTSLFSNATMGLSYETSVLDTQSEEYDPSLDLLVGGAAKSSEVTNYYFSGLSFSPYPRTGNITHTSSSIKNAKGQIIVSLLILEKKSGSWTIHEPAYLPKVKHGTTTDSVILGDTTINDDLTVNNNITVDNLIKSLDIEATNKTKTKLLEVTDTADVKKVLNVHNTANDAQANIDKADIEYADITDTDISVARINKLSISGTGDNKTSLAEADITNLTAASAKITTLTVPFKSDSKNTILNSNGITTPYIDAESIIADTISTTPVDGKSVSMSGGDLTVNKTATVNTTLKVHNTSDTATADVDKAIFRKTAEVEGTLTATVDLKDTSNKPVNNATIKRASIETVTSIDVNTTRVAASEKVSAPALYQTVNNKDMKVPVIELEPKTINSKQFYQLKISRIGPKN